MKIKKLLAVVLSVSIIATSFSSVVQISAQTDEHVSIQFAQVTESEDSSMQTTARPAEPTEEFIISGEGDFELFMTTSELWESNYKVTLTCDIDIKGKTFNPIKEFNGVFDGCGHNISNLKIQNKSDKNKNFELAFINTLNEFAKIKNVTLDNYTIEGNSYIRKAAGFIVTNHGTISGVDIINSSINNIDKKVKSAGFVLNNEEDGVIENSHIENMSAKNSKIRSGFVETNYGKITNCSTTLSVDNKDIASGFVIENLGIIEKCSFKGDVSSRKCAGGFCGSNSGEITSCTSEGNVTAKTKLTKLATICGGFVGENSGIIKESGANGKVEGQEFTGGFAGINSDKGELINCKTICDLKAHTYVASICCGGIAGLNAGKMEKCNFDGNLYSCVDNEKVLGGVVAAVVSAAIIGIIIYFMVKYGKNEPELVSKTREETINKYKEAQAKLDNDRKALDDATKESVDIYKQINRTFDESEINALFDKHTKLDFDTLNSNFKNSEIEFNMAKKSFKLIDDNIYKVIIKLFFKDVFVISILIGGGLGVVSGCAVNFTIGTKCANSGACVGYNIGEINWCSVNCKKITAKTLYNKHNKCGGFVGTNGETGTIKNCSATGNEIHNKTYTGGHLGGFVGDNSGKIENGTTTVPVTNGKCTGGFCGNNSGEISGSTSEGNAKANATTVKTKCGGFVGDNNEKGKIDGCTATGSAIGQEYVGGFAGVNKSDIIDCDAHGKATAKTKTNIALAGGFVGENEKGTIISCTATGGADSQSISGQAKAGGFVGVNKSIIMSSKASGYVYLSAGTFYKDDGCGGFVGKNDQVGSIYGCYAECMVETTNKKKGGGFVGEAVGKSTIKNSKCKAKIITKAGVKSQTKFY